MLRKVAYLGLWLLMPGVWLVSGSGFADLPDKRLKSKNILVFIFDDYGALSAQSYQDLWNPARVAPTPHFNRICQKGVRFTNTWSYPTCSPTRSSMITGSFGFRTGVGAPCFEGNNEISPRAQTLPRIIRSQNPAYGLASIGKWHLGTSEDKSGDLAPNFMGWDYYAGLLGGMLSDYYSWDRTVNGKTETVSRYATTQNIDDAIGWIDSLSPGQPFFLWVGINAPHTPLHLPPQSLHSYDLSENENEIEKNPLSYFEAMVESADTELGRLLAHLPDNDRDGLPDDTVIMVLGDNGTLNNRMVRLLPSPYQDLSGKGSLYEHGVRVPLCIAGSGVESGKDVNNFIHVVDIHSTVLAQAGVDSDPAERTYRSDSMDLSPYLEGQVPGTPRECLFTEQFNGVNSMMMEGAAVRCGDYRFIGYTKMNREREECYNLTDDPSESINLLRRGDAVDQRQCQEVKNKLLGIVCSEESGVWKQWCS